MNQNTKTVLALLLLAGAVSCKQYDANTEAMADTVAVVTDSKTPKTVKGRKFIRTADLQFKVSDVARSTTAIEDATKHFGGFVTFTDLQSQITEEKRVKVCQDSTMVLTRYTVTNQITLRVPNTKMDTLIKTISKQIGFLNHRTIKADEVTLQLLSNTFSRQRKTETGKRLEKAIDAKGKKLNQIVSAEATLDEQKEASDTKIIENLSLEDQVNFSTVTLNVYQDERLRQELIPNGKDISDYRPNLGLQLWDSVKTGWFVIEKIVSFLAILWPFGLIVGLVLVVVKKRRRKLP